MLGLHLALFPLPAVVVLVGCNCHGGDEKREEGKETSSDLANQLRICLHRIEMVIARVMLP